ncbi:uncharacterized protein [Miscanthus floridulus]|uniref:uncharacterized protein isoform X5 n=1 Tax=Miscanthus floridulus TaxID=154761 RepID=UPI003457BF59
MTPSPTPTAMATAAPATSPSTSLCLGFGSSSTDGWPAEPEQPPARCRWGTCCELPVGYVQLPVGIAGPLLLDGCQLPSSSSRRRGGWCSMEVVGVTCMALQPWPGNRSRYLRTCINENPGCLFITTNRDPTRLMTSAQEWSGARNMVAAVSCSLQSNVLNSKMEG